MAEQYVSAFSKLAKDSNTILLPSNPGDVTSMVAQVRVPSIEYQRLRPHHHHLHLYTVEVFRVLWDLDLPSFMIENRSLRMRYPYSPLEMGKLLRHLFLFLQIPVLVF